MNKIPPQDLESEKTVIGCCLLSKESVDIAVELVSPGDFYHNALMEIFTAIRDLFNNSEPIDVGTVIGRLKDKNKYETVGGVGYLSDLLDVIISAKRVKWHCQRIAEKARLRRMISHCQEIIAQCYSGEKIKDVADFAETGLFDISADKVENIKKIDTYVRETFGLLEVRSEGGEINGIETGLYDLDRKLSGLHGGEFLVLAGRPSMGKTALAMNIAQNVAMDSNVPVMVFSLEMPGQQLAERMLSGVASVNGQAMRTGSLVESDWPKLTNAAGELSQAPIYVDDSSNVSIVDIRARVRRMKSRFDIGLVVIDYLQLMKGSSKGNREQEIAEISRGLKVLAKEIDIPVIALSQLNRSVEQRNDKRPLLSDLRESGSIEQDTDVVMFIYRDEYYNPGMGNENMAELIVAKQRNGPVGKINLVFQKEFSTFRSMA